MSSRPRLLDLFCGAGGAAMGYHRAGFDIVGVDINPQPHYPFEFVQVDALSLLDDYLEDPPDGGIPFDAIHASPPCQAFTDLNQMWNSLEHPDLLIPTRTRLQAIGLPYVIENVEGAPMVDYITLCGTAFGLGTCKADLWRHRRFESNIPWPVLLPGCSHGKMRVIGIYGGHGRDRRRHRNTQDYPTSDRRIAMGIDWMTGEELSQAIPPAYTEWIGSHLLEWVLAA